MRKGEPTRRSSGLPKAIAAPLPLVLPWRWTRSWSISQRVLPFWSGAPISNSQDGGDHARHYQTKAQDKTPDGDGHRDVAFIERIIEINLRSKLVEHFVPDPHEQDG